jgi:hypothetical protein
MQVVGAIVMVVLAAQPLIAIAVAGGHQQVVDAAGGVLKEGQDRASLVGAHDVADLGDDLQDLRAGVLHGHEFCEVLGVERPGVDDLLAMGVDDLDELALGDTRRFALAGGDGDERHG